MLLLYRAMIWIVLMLGSPYLLIKALFGRHGIKERFGYIKNRESSGRLFWFHAASVGELKIISSVLPAISDIDGAVEFAISTTTITGRKRATDLFGEKAYIFLQPLELKSSIIRVIDSLKPEKLIVVETELWPLMLSIADDLGVSLYLVNARMGEDSYKKYKLAKPLFAPVLKKFSRVLAQTKADAERFRGLGAENAEVAGNLKYDQVLTNNVPNGPRLKVVGNGKFIFVAGSIRKGEDEILADVISRALESGLDMRFILVPRHMKEIADVENVLNNRNIRYRLRSDMADNTIDLDSVLLVNTMGELRDFYSIADIAFVGGSLVPVGGHDPLEPAALGKPVIFGPYMENARDAADILLESGGATQVMGKYDLFDILKESRLDRHLLEIKGEKCKKAILSMSGVSGKVARILIGGKI